MIVQSQAISKVFLCFLCIYLILLFNFNDEFASQINYSDIITD